MTNADPYDLGQPPAQLCRCCGQTLPPPRPESLALPPGYSIIFDRVHRAGKYGIWQRELFEHVYGNTPNGGPDSGASSLRTRIFYLNKRYLLKHGMRIRAKSGRGSTGYVLQFLTEMGTPREAWRA